MNKKGIHYTVLDAEENQDLVKKYDIMQAPALVTVNDGTAQVYSNASNIMKFLNEHMQA